MPSFLIIQTAFIGDVVLATALVEKLHASYPDAPIDFLLRKGNEDLLKGHPFLREVLVWDKKSRKIRNLLAVIRKVRSKRYTHLINVHRFASSGLISLFSGAGFRIGFDKNPLSVFYSKKVRHVLAAGTHEISRNQLLISELTGPEPVRPKLYPSDQDRDRVAPYVGAGPYVCLAPTSVWYTKQFPQEKWIEFLDQFPDNHKVYLLGGPADRLACEAIRAGTKYQNVVNLAGQLKFLESAILMEGALMNYANDSAPIHFASAMNAPVTAVFCSTVQSFGFGPLSDVQFIAETQEVLTCRPCGLHGFKSCPEGHFRCAKTIMPEQMNRGLVNFELP